MPLPLKGNDLKGNPSVSSSSSSSSSSNAQADNAAAAAAFARSKAKLQFTVDEFLERLKGQEGEKYFMSSHFILFVTEIQ